MPQQFPGQCFMFLDGALDKKYPFSKPILTEYPENRQRSEDGLKGKEEPVFPLCSCRSEADQLVTGGLCSCPTDGGQWVLWSFLSIPVLCPQDSACTLAGQHTRSYRRWHLCTLHMLKDSLCHFPSRFVYLSCFFLFSLAMDHSMCQSLSPNTWQNEFYRKLHSSSPFQSQLLFLSLCLPHFSTPAGADCSGEASSPAQKLKPTVWGSCSSQLSGWLMSPALLPSQWAHSSAQRSLGWGHGWTPGGCSGAPPWIKTHRPCGLSITWVRLALWRICGQSLLQKDTDHLWVCHLSAFVVLPGDSCGSGPIFTCAHWCLQWLCFGELHSTSLNLPEN